MLQINTPNRRRLQPTPIVTLKRRRWRQSRRLSVVVGTNGDTSACCWRRSRRFSSLLASIATLKRCCWHQWRRFSSPLASIATLQLAVGVDSNASTRRWCQSRCFSSLLASIATLKHHCWHQWRRFNSPLASIVTLQLAVGVDRDTSACKTFTTL